MSDHTQHSSVHGSYMDHQEEENLRHELQNKKRRNIIT